MNWNATSSDIQDTIPRNWLPRNWNSNKSNRTIQLWNLSEGQIMKKQQEYVARVEHLIWPFQLIVPEVVRTSEDDGLKSIEYQNLVQVSWFINWINQRPTKTN